MLGTVFQRIVTVVAVCVTLSISGLAQVSTKEPDLPTFRVDTGLVLVDVIPEYSAQHRIALLTDLKRDDFRVFDNRKEMPVQSFDVGANQGTRPIALWLIVQCVEEFPLAWHSEFMRGDVHFFKPAMAHLEPNDAVGVAHWCDDGVAALDVKPGKDVNGAISAVEQVINGKMVHGDNRSGQLAMQKMIEMIVENAQQSTPQRLPVMVFLYGDHCGTYTQEADKIIEDVMKTSGIVFGLSDGHWKFDPKELSAAGEVGYLVHYYSGETGGEFYTVADPKTGYSGALDYILSQVHLRYTLGFRPQVLDGKHHKLKVELTKEAQGRYKNVQLRFRTEYVPAASK